MSTSETPVQPSSMRTDNEAPDAVPTGDLGNDPLREVSRGVLRRLLALVEGAADDGDANAETPLDRPTPSPLQVEGQGPATLPLPVVEPAVAAPPVDAHAAPLAVARAFAFVDISGFTAYCDRHGEREALEVLTRFRSVTRDVVGRRGVRVAKWLGDGVMLVGTDPGPLVAAVVELEGRFRATGLTTHTGLAWGPVLLFEGDDYVGRTVNLAARLADIAGPGEVLAAGLPDDLPAWVERRGVRAADLAGMGRVEGIARLGAAPEVERTLLLGEPAA